MQEFSPEGEGAQKDLLREGKQRELAAWGKFDVYTQRNSCNASKNIAQTRWVLTWEMADREKSVKARMAAEGSQDPD